MGKIFSRKLKSLSSHQHSLEMAVLIAKRDVEIAIDVLLSASDPNLFGRVVELSYRKNGRESPGFPSTPEEQHELVDLWTNQPESVWLSICEELEDTTVEKLCNASLYFRYINRKNRTIFLFPKVVHLLAHNFHRLHSQDTVYNAADPSVSSLTCAECGRTRYTRWYSGLLNLRLVCRPWCTTIDSYCHHKEGPYYVPYVQVESSIAPWKMDYFITAQDCIDFLAHFKPTHVDTDRSPFIGHAVTMHYSDYDRVENNPYFETDMKFRLLLKYFGSHIHYFSILGTHVPMETPVEMYTGLLEILSLVPNLIGLGLFYGYQLDAYSEEYLNLWAKIQDNPFPTFDNLKVIQSFFLPPALSNAMIRRNSQVSELFFVPMGFTENDTKPDHHVNDMYTFPLPNLTGLYANFNSLLEFQQLTVPDWPLEKLSVSIHFKPWTDLNECTGVIFDVISSNGKANTLTNVEIDFPIEWTAHPANSNFISPMKYCHMLRLNVRVLKVFKIVMKDPMSLDFLLMASNTLESLSVEFFREFNDPAFQRVLAELEEESSVKCFSYIVQGRSNIWTTFTALREVKINGRFWPQHIFLRGR